MDFDMAIASDEGHSPDPLFSSIINAMNSMKEATADKIYQKIQREGSTNYSKPQVRKLLLLLQMLIRKACTCTCTINEIHFSKQHKML